MDFKVTDQSNFILLVCCTKCIKISNLETISSKKMKLLNKFVLHPIDFQWVIEKESKISAYLLNNFILSPSENTTKQII
jgi:hypothetical protein